MVGGELAPEKLPSGFHELTVAFVCLRPPPPHYLKSEIKGQLANYPLVLVLLKIIQVHQLRKSGNSGHCPKEPSVRCDSDQRDGIQ